MLIALSLTTVVNAETATIVFVDKDGKAEFIASDSSVDDTNVALGADNEVESGASTLIIEEGKKPVWTKESPNEIDKRYGGDGSPKIKLIPKKPNKPIKLDFKKKKNIELFDDPTAMQPEDGIWQLTVISNTYDAGCPTDPFPPASIAGMTRPVDIKWGNPWKPTAFFQHYPTSSNFNYVQTSPMHWKVSGNMLKSMPNSSVTLKEDFTLISPKEIKVNATMHMEMTIPIQGIKMIDCKGHLKMLAKHIKSPKIKVN